MASCSDNYWSTTENNNNNAWNFNSNGWNNNNKTNSNGVRPVSLIVGHTYRSEVQSKMIRERGSCAGQS
ncbi:MAG: hypothetical protein IJ067_01615 [Prevotella sp.]|nr:hypothetical protein [Prevotella sp.]